jgi:hypothetical protein
MSDIIGDGMIKVFYRFQRRQAGDPWQLYQVKTLVYQWRKRAWHNCESDTTGEAYSFAGSTLFAPARLCAHGVVSFEHVFETA